MVAIRGHYDGKAIIPDEPVDLPRNQALLIHVESVPPSGPPAGMTGQQVLESGLVGIWRDRDDIGDSLDFARKLREESQSRGK